MAALIELLVDWAYNMNIFHEKWYLIIYHKKYKYEFKFFVHKYNTYTLEKKWQSLWKLHEFWFSIIP